MRLERDLLRGRATRHHGLLKSHRVSVVAHELLIGFRHGVCTTPSCGMCIRKLPKYPRRLRRWRDAGASIASTALGSLNMLRGSKIKESIRSECNSDLIRGHILGVISEHLLSAILNTTAADWVGVYITATDFFPSITLNLLTCTSCMCTSSLNRYTGTTRH